MALLIPGEGIRKHCEYLIPHNTYEEMGSVGFTNIEGAVCVHWHSHINIVDAVGAMNIREVICRELCGIAC